jgi:adenylate cyclase
MRMDAPAPVPDLERSGAPDLASRGDRRLRGPLLARIARIGAPAIETGDIRLRRVLLVASSLVCTVAGIIWGLTYLAVGAPVAATMPLAYSLAAAASTAAFAIRRQYRAYRYIQLALILLLPWLMSISLGGFQASSAVLIWSILAPLGALLFASVREATAWFVAFLVLVALTAMVPFSAFDDPLPPGFVNAFFGLNIAALFAIVFAMTAYFIRERDAFERKSEMLILSILPRGIAELLREGPRRIADHHDAASILFADVVGFTRLAAGLRPGDLISLLDEVFLAFDHLVEVHDLEKIKTIGDCYMVASGVPNPRGDHADALARFALDLKACAETRRFLGRRIELRIGMNSGPVVAGVIGRRKFIYDLWGDAVNVASRLESHGEGGAIQMTRASYELLKHRFVCRRAGVIRLKGIGETEVFHLMGERSDGGRGSA